MRRLELKDWVTTSKQTVAKMTLSPSEERFTLRVAESTDSATRGALVHLAEHLKESVDTEVTLRGKVRYRHNSLQVLLESESKKVKRSLILDLSDYSFKKPEEFYRQKQLKEIEVSNDF